MRVVGLTGGIGTGKTTVAQVFSDADVPVIDADQIARRVVLPGRPAHKALMRAFGPAYFNTDGTLNREKLGLLVFADDQARRRLNAATHPYVRQEVLLELIQCFFQGCALVVFDSALLIETRVYKYVWPVVVVDCEPKIQLQRVMERDHLSRQDALNRINSQMSLDEKRKCATVVIDNNGSIDVTRRQVKQTLATYTPPPEQTQLWYYLLLVPMLCLWIFLKLYAFVKW